MLSELPDLWDVNISDWANDSATSRFGEEAAQERYISFVKELTRKPVVGVGRFTSPDIMVSQIRRGVLDFIGAARPSIADPFLPKKIEEGRPEDIRECIGCNICVSGDWTQSPIRCTQNPTMAEEWRRGWHPEKMNTKGASSRVLVVGGGPAGLEAALSLGRRGYEVALADSGPGGGRILGETTLPGLATWRRVLDYRLNQIEKLNQISFFPGSKMDIETILEFDADQVAIATGATWRRDGVGRATWRPIIANLEESKIFTPDAIFIGVQPEIGPVVIYDDDHYYLGGIIAELLVSAGISVTLVTPGPEVSHWTQNTMEQHRIEERLLSFGVPLICKQTLLSAQSDHIVTYCNLTGKQYSLAATSLILVTARLPTNKLYFDLAGCQEEQLEALPFGLSRIGDCLAPSTIAAAVYDGHRYARELDNTPEEDEVPFRREYTLIE